MALTIIVVMSGATITMEGTIVTAKRTATIEKTEIIVETVPDRLLAVRTMKIVVPGLHPRGGRKTKGLQGTMITGEEAMMIAEYLIIIMTVAGMTPIAEEMIREEKTKKIVTKTEMQGMRMGRVDGPVEWIGVRSASTSGIVRRSVVNSLSLGLSSIGVVILRGP